MEALGLDVEVEQASTEQLGKDTGRRCSPEVSTGLTHGSPPIGGPSPFLKSF